MAVSVNTKPVISELKAAFQSHMYIFHAARERWPTIYKQFRKVFGDKFRVDDESIATFDLALAATALDLQAVRNLFPTDQAKRIEGWVEKLVDSKEYGQYAIEEVRAYSEQFQRDAENIENGDDSLSAIPTRLLQRWLGKRMHDFELKIGGKRTGYMDPCMIDLAVGVIIPFAGTWKAIKDRYELIEEDLPMEPNYEAMGLYEVGRCPDDSRPDGTVIYREDNGEMKETWLAPKKIDQLFAKHHVRKIGMICRVLVKGPWEGVKETRMQLTDQIIAEFADESGVVFALCHFTRAK